VSRIVKEPEVRRKELLDIAEDMIIEKGYDDLTVTDIITEAKIAKGTFYHYFKSKDDVLLALADRYMDDILEIMDRIDEDKSISAIQKIFKLFRMSMEYKMDHKHKERLTDYIHDDKNILVHHQLEVKNIPIFEHFFERLIIDGTEEGIFDVKYPRETAVAIVATFTAFGHGDKKLSEYTNEEKLQSFYAFISLLERILGTKNGAFDEVIKMVEGYR